MMQAFRIIWITHKHVQAFKFIFDRGDASEGKKRAIPVEISPKEKLLKLSLAHG